jgi:hypothetical protein
MPLLPFTFQLVTPFLYPSPFSDSILATSLNGMVTNTHTRRRELGELRKNLGLQPYGKSALFI